MEIDMENFELRYWHIAAAWAACIAWWNLFDWLLP
jgi:hypothetical protein